MKLSKIFKNVDLLTADYPDLDISHLSISTTEILPNTLYFCIKGQQEDGHRLAHQAIKLGAVALVVEHRVEVDVPQIVVGDVRAVVGLCAANFYDNPRNKFRLIGVTGTNGKTTTTYMLKSILETAGYHVGLIGTIGNMIGEVNFPAHLTTPDPIELHEIFARMARERVDYVVMEVSAHAIALNKMAGVVCDVGILTNITQDHLDFFGTFDNYKDTKLRFLEPSFCHHAVANIDDPEIREHILSHPERGIQTFGLNNPSDIFATKINYSMLGTSYFINLDDYVCAVNMRLIGEFNLYNAMGAAAACLCMGIDAQTIAVGLSSCDFVAGRCNIIELKNGAFAVVDYAHTPDGLKNILTSVRALCKGRLYSLFGCGGNRDTSKRSIMGGISATLADYTVITSDNPRLEDPAAIMREIEAGVAPKTENYCCIQNRKEAILTTIKTLHRNDVIVIAGKGAENYMDISGQKLPYSDFEVLQEVKK